MVEAAVHRVLGIYKKYVDRFIVPSKFYINKFVEWGWEPGRFVHIPNFIDTALYAPKYDVGRPYLYFGRLSREKGLATLIRAAANADAAVKIIGTGSDEVGLRELANQLGSRVEFVGYLSGEPLREAIRSARAVVVPSEWYENAPMSIIESYALGKPVVGSAIGGIPELVRENETGITFESGSIEGLTAALSGFSRLSQSQVSAMGRAGRSWVESEFCAQKYKERMLQSYIEVGVRV